MKPVSSLPVWPPFLFSLFIYLFLCISSSRGRRGDEMLTIQTECLVSAGRHGESCGRGSAKKQGFQKNTSQRERSGLLSIKMSPNYERMNPQEGNKQPVVWVWWKETSSCRVFTLLQQKRVFFYLYIKWEKCVEIITKHAKYKQSYWDNAENVKTSLSCHIMFSLKAKDLRL